MDQLMKMALGLAVVLPIVFLITAYLMAAYGELRDYKFGVSVEIATWLAVACLFVGHVVAPDLWPRLGLSESDAVFLSFGVIIASGIVGAMLDAITWILRKISAP
jgi:hypothetical protein